ncbi:MAG: alpha/beta fold hydrolase [Kineosporiaceae bacterium]
MLIALASATLAACSGSAPGAGDPASGTAAGESPGPQGSSLSVDAALTDRRDTPVGPVATTAESSFDGVDFPEPRYVEVMPGGIRMAYVAEGPSDGPVVLLLHGNPAWSYYYRDVIDGLVAEGFRVVAPDLVGFGRSEKPLDRDAMTYENQVAWVESFVTELDLTGITMHAHDWGGLIGMRVVPRIPDRFAAVGIANTGLPDGYPAPQGFQQWQRASQVLPRFSTVLQRGSTRELSAEELAAFDAPWPVTELTAGPRQLPLEVPFGDSPQAAANREALEFWATWRKPFGIVFADGGSDGAPGIDPQEYADLVPGTVPGQPVLVPDTGHFLHLDVPEVVVEHTAGLAEAAG